MNAERLLGLLQTHISARKTGVFEISAAHSTANISLSKGEVVVAECGRAEGEKAFYRALTLRDARSAFYERDVSRKRNVETTTEKLLAAAAAVIDETTELLSLFSGDAPFVAIDPGPPTVNLTGARPAEVSTAARSLLHFLRVPVRLADLLDADSGSDHEILIGLAELEKAGRLRVLASPKSKVVMATGEELVQIERALASRPMAAQGARPRLVVAGAPHRLALVAHAVSCFEGAHLPTEIPPGNSPAVPMPHVVARWTSDRIDLDIVVCPLVPAYSPLWPMTVTGAHAALRLDFAARELFERACSEAGVNIVDAEAILPSHDDTRVADVAALIRGALLK